MAFGNPQALMGFIGFVKFDTLQVRARSCDIRLTQEITKPDVIDSRYDRTVYQLGPKMVEGSVEYPAIMEDVNGGLDPTATLYTKCVQRNPDGRLNPTNVSVKYTSENASFRYNSCIVNSWRFAAAQSDVVSVTVDVIGLDRVSANLTPNTVTNSRIVTWADVRLRIFGGQGNLDIPGDYIRNFEIGINNNAERYYTFNQRLEPQDIAPRKRDIEGSMVLMGRHPQLALHAESNQDRCYEDTFLRFGYQLTNTQCQGTFLVTLPNIIFQIEELALTNDLFETTVAWHCLPNEADLTDSSVLDTGT